MDREIIAGKLYRHFKGNVYLIDGIGMDADNNAQVVLYRDVRQPNRTWVRSYDEFISEVDREKYPDVKQHYRFEEIPGVDESNIGKACLGCRKILQCLEIEESGCQYSMA
ncbi:DUF1653 domain-containing protein [Ileibacterium valens]|uniref:DUF1653 domain-containing protein n=1 Tax=Ileibacterium valens TaxID=1862668 RepID=A0A1U7NHX5_9FIRM|nr:DUF1653 domain-containing protein [Ileibacterium valens]OLU40442.1 hypothetical protein BO224_05470 [Erysipelotrichaceae bacterium NYU-BL-E8]OLU41662.1 hypothetical protein BO222_02870 [Ileibacterium valens]OLU42866.1 hypothetical protein BM735_01355 [Erysipelotrichaceae bacterium NYU-BL-F16]